MNSKIMLPTSLSVVIPLYNEGSRFINNFKVCQRYYKEYPGWEFIFVNDGSIDQTKQLVQSKLKLFPRMILVSYLKNKGKGYAIKKGVLKSTKKLILTSDIDFSTPVDNLGLFYPFIKNGADVVIGTRKVQGSRIIQRQPVLREWLGKRFTDLANLMFGLNISDYTCGFKLFTSQAAKKVFSELTVNRWAFDAEILLLVKNSGFNLVEVPVTWTNDDRTRVRLVKDIFQSIKELIQIKL